MAANIIGIKKGAAHRSLACSLLNLKSLVKQGKVCCCAGVGQGIIAQNGCSISSRYNEAIRHHSRAIYTVAFSPIE